MEGSVTDFYQPFIAHRCSLYLIPPLHLITLYNQCGDARSGKVAGIIKLNTIAITCACPATIVTARGDFWESGSKMRGTWEV
jgi:hypothetical protein